MRAAISSSFRCVGYGSVLSAAVLLAPTTAFAQCPGGICAVGDEASLRAAISTAVSGDTIRFTNTITLTAADLPAIQTGGTITLDGGGFVLDGAGQFRGLVVGYSVGGTGPPPAVVVNLQNVTIQNTIATGGTGGSGAAGGGGGAGLGGALLVGTGATVNVSNVNLSGNSAIGGAGGVGGVAGAIGGGGGGGLGGNGGSGDGFVAGGGGGFGGGAAGGGGGTTFNGSSGILNLSGPGGDTGGGSGGAFGGGGGAVGGSGSTAGGGGPAAGFSGNGTDGGGGGGAWNAGPFAGAGGLGGGGGAGIGAADGGAGGFGGGGGGSIGSGAGGVAGAFGGDGSASGSGGGGAGLGGAVFLANNGGIPGRLNIVGPFTVTGATVSGGAGSSGAANGVGAGAGIFISATFGSNYVTFTPSAGQTITIASAIADEANSGGNANNWGTLNISGAGTVILSGNNHYGATGVFSTVVDGGATLSISSVNNLGNATSDLRLFAGSVLRITGSSTFTQGLYLENGLGTVSIAPGQTATWAGQVEEGIVTPAILEVTGGGTMMLTNAANQHTVANVIHNGSELIVTSDGALGLATSNVFIGDASSTGALGISSPAFSSARSIAIGAGGGTVDTIGSTTNAVWSGAVGGTGTFTKAGAGTLTLSGSNTYSGATSVYGGTLVAGSAGAFGASRTLFVNDGASVDLNGFSQNFFSISGGGSLGLNGGAFLTVGADNSSSLFSGAISGSGGIIKSGTGTLSLVSANSFSGGVALNGGALSLQSPDSLGTGPLSMASGTLLQTTTGGVFSNALGLSGQATVNAPAGQTIAWNGQISDNGSVGTLNLTGGGSFALGNSANSYSGGTIVTGNSSLAVGSDGALGSGTLQLGDAASSGTLAIDAGGLFLSSRAIVVGGLGAFIDTATGTDARFSGNITGGGGITKSGAGSLTLIGNNTFKGPLILTGGTLRGGGASVLAPGVLSLGGGTTLDLNGFDGTVGSLAGSGSVILGGGAFLTLGGDDSNSLFGGSISGSGGLIKNGAGLLSLTATNNFTGGIRLNAGTLLGNTNSLVGNIINNGTVVFDQGFDGAYAGAMNGAGSLIKNGVGVLTLSGTNTYTGGTLINGGGIAGTTSSLQGLIVNNTTLTFNQTVDGVFNGSIAGSGTVTKLGAGNATFGSFNSYTGLTTVGQGTLTMNNATLPGSVSVGTQATFAGTGTIGGNLTLGGRLLLPGITQAAAAAAGVSGFNQARSAVIVPFALRDLPSMVVNGDLLANQGSSLNFTVAAAGAAPILVNGRASLIGSHLNVLIDDPNPARRATYTALRALGGLSVAGTDASTTSTSVLPVVTQSQDSMLITILNISVPTTSIATTPNGIAAGRGIDAVKNCQTGDICNVVKEVLALDDQELDTALRGLAGEIHASTLRMTVNDSRVVTDMVRNQLSDAEHEAEDGQGGNGIQPWLQFSGEHSTFKTSEFSGGTANLGGGGGGVNLKPIGRMLAGIGGAFSLGSLSLSDISGQATLKAPRALGYTGFRFGAFHVHAGSSVAKNNNGTKRDVKIHAQVPDANGNLVPMSNGVDREADSDQDGYTEDLWGDLQHTYKKPSWLMDSKVGLRATRYVRRAFTETGGASISLDGAEEVLQSRELRFDFHAFKKTGGWRPRVLLNYMREFGDDATSADVNFKERPESQFQVTGLPIPRDMFHGLFGLTMRSMSGLEYTVEYETTQATNESHNAVHFRMRFR